MNSVELGTVIAGTMREQDLVPAFLDELTRIDPEAARAIRQEYAETITQVTRAETLPEDVRFVTDMGWLIEDIYDALNAHAPWGMYFGAHPGDGSDFGWWVREDGEEEVRE